MRILLTNDDGIFAPGLAALYKQLKSLGEVTVVAPASGQSGASHSITFAEPLACRKVRVNSDFEGYSVEGSPADCVKLAFLQLHEKPIDLVVAGINAGANVGVNVYYSGTVAAAMEGAFLGIPSVAISQAFEKEMDYDRGGKYGTDVIRNLLPIQPGHVVNVNIPLLSKGRPKGIKVVPQSTEGFHEYYIPKTDQANGIVYQLAGGPHRFQVQNTDIMAIADGYLTVTALIPDMTHHKKTKDLGKTKWNKDIFQE